MAAPTLPAAPPAEQKTSSWADYTVVLAIVTLCTGLNWILSRWLSLTDLAMVYLLGVVAAAIHFRWDVSIAGALLSLLAFDFFFVPPVLTLRFGKNEHLITGIVLLLVGVITSVLASRVRRSLQLANDAALAAHDEQLRNSLLASVSHDLRTPLAVIAGSASTLRENRSQLSIQEQDQLLEAIFEQSRTMSLEISDVLEMTRLHAGPVALHREWYPVEELVGAALERCKSKLSRHSVSTHIAADLPMIFVDGVLVEKLFVNLIENAAKYTEPGTHVRISGSCADQWSRVIVEDDGPGLPAGFEDRLFQKFARGFYERATPGSGLGLSICKAIVELHGMTIEACNRPEGGARFSVSIPYLPPPDSQPEFQ